jgi:DNA-binding transcriptional MerR regulator
MTDQPETVVSTEHFTIDELAAKTGVPSRTIRFYQAKGVLPAPRRDGRVAYYDQTHVERLEVVGKLQDKGLHLRAIRDVVTRRDLDGTAIQKWLGVGERLGELSGDTPQLLTEDELKQFLGDPPPGIIGRLVRHGGVTMEGDGATRRYLVKSPGLLTLGAKLVRAGVQIDTALAMHDILQRRLARTADELVEFAAKNVGKGFGRSNAPDDVMTVLETLFEGDVGAEAVKLLFKKEVERAIQGVLPISAKR